jgi:hypothetical protein
MTAMAGEQLRRTCHHDNALATIAPMHVIRESSRAAPDLI